MKLRTVFILFGVFGIQFLKAQINDSLPLNIDSLRRQLNSVIPDSDAKKKVVISKIILIGNKTTKPGIVTRELIFHEGDTLSKFDLQNAMQRSRENLLNTSLFNFVDVFDQQDANDSTRTFIIVRMAERWYLFPLPIFELVDRNFNEWWLTKDFSRTNYGAYITKENFLGRKQSLQVLVRLGYSQRLGLYYSIPYINRKQENGLAFSFSYTRNHEIAYNVFDNKLEFYKDENNYVRKQFSTGTRFTHRNGIHDYHSYTAEYQDNQIEDSIVRLNENYFLNNSSRQKLFILSYQFKRDYRDFKNYPLKGYYFDYEVVKQGLGILENEPALLALTSNYRKYWEISPRWHFAAGIKGKLTGQSFAPYYNSRGLGYANDFVRGYEYYVVNGQNYALIKSNIKFTLVPEQVLKIKYIPVEKFNTIPFAFYINLFADAGYVKDREFFEYNSLTNSYLFGYGIGLDYVTYYDVVLRLEYSFNKMGEHGFFLHFVSPIW